MTREKIYRFDFESGGETFTVSFKINSEQREMILGLTDIEERAGSNYLRIFQQPPTSLDIMAFRKLHEHLRNVWYGEEQDMGFDPDEAPIVRRLYLVGKPERGRNIDS